MRRYSQICNGIILKRYRTPKGDVIVNILSPTGKIKAISYGGKTGKQSGGLNLFHHVELKLKETRTDFFSIEEAYLKGALSGLAEPEKYVYASILAEIADNLFQLSDFDYAQDAFMTFVIGLKGINRAKDFEWYAIVIVFKLLGIAGFIPNFTCDCGDKSTKNLSLFGEILCDNCVRSQKRNLKFKLETVEFFNNVLITPTEFSLQNPVPKNQRRAIWFFLKKYISSNIAFVKSFSALDYV